MVKNIVRLLLYILGFLVKGPIIIAFCTLMFIAIVCVGIGLLFLSYHVARFALDLVGVDESYGTPIAIAFSLMVGYSYTTVIQAVQRPSVDYHSLRGRKLEES